MLLTGVGYGRTVGLRVLPVDDDHIRPRLPHWWVDTDAEPEQTWELTCPCHTEGVVRQLELWVAEHAADLIFVHAAVVAIDGRAILLPGRSTCGKTTLTAALLRAGAVYGSDEYAVLSSDGKVHPYPRPLYMRNGAGRERTSPSELGAATFAEPLPVAAVAHLRYEPDSQYLVEPISAGVAVLRLFDNTVGAQSRAEEALDALIAATDGIRAVDGVRGEAELAVPKIRTLISP